ncbi:uncharacterized protein LOC131671372 [Phymastichus coffea]|uniref:uncharacterized protein LOC131671372 n=1 Tax=Phymastichus coffea TaxID=108790 RepID=UPI00273BADA4|nr:uncharacterized protein LOC131671372 [Phymastichus coffea]
MHQRSWISHCIIPCPGTNFCQFYNPGEIDHPLQHTVSKVIYEVDKSFSSYASRKISVSSSINGNSNNKSSNKRLVLSGRFLQNLAPVPFDSKIDPPQIKACFNCWHMNHKLENCYVKKRNIFCSNCGRKYVEVEDCPRCAKAYCEYIEEEEHIRAKIEIYGDVEDDYFYKKRIKSNKFKLVKNKNPNSGESTERKNYLWSDSLYNSVLRTSIAINTKDSYLVFSSAQDSKYKDEWKNNYKNVSTNFLKEFQTINLNTKEKGKNETSASHHMLDSNMKKDYYKEQIESEKYAIINDKCKSREVNCERAETREDRLDFQSLTSLLISKLEDENDDLDDMIFIDEYEKSIESSAMETNFIEDDDQAYQHLLSVIKNLPEEAQQVAVRCFFNSQKKKSTVKS